MKRRDLLWLAPSWLAGAACGHDDAANAISDYERASGGHLGLHAEDVVTGQQMTWRADERFVMCSTFKASLAACVLARVDRGRDSLEQVIRYGSVDMRYGYAPVALENLAQGGMTVGAMCRAAVEESDNTCANLLLARIGGPSALTGFWRHALNDRVTRLEDPEPDLNRTPPGGARNTTTPRAMAHILRELIWGSVLAEPSRKTLTDWLIGCRTGDRRLRAGIPPGWRIGDKTGNNGKDAAGDIAVAWPSAQRPIVVCVYTRGGQPTPAQLDAVFAGVGRFIGEHFS